MRFSWLGCILAFLFLALGVFMSFMAMIAGMAQPGSGGDPHSLLFPGMPWRLISPYDFNMYLFGVLINAAIVYLIGMWVERLVRRK